MGIAGGRRAMGGRAGTRQGKLDEYSTSLPTSTRELVFKLEFHLPSPCPRFTYI